MNNIIVYIIIAIIIGFFFNKLITKFFGKVLNAQDQELENKQKEIQIKLDKTKQMLLDEESNKPIAEKMSNEEIEDFWKKNTKD